MTHQFKNQIIIQVAGTVNGQAETTNVSAKAQNDDVAFCLMQARYATVDDFPARRTTLPVVVEYEGATYHYEIRRNRRTFNGLEYCG